MATAVKIFFSAQSVWPRFYSLSRNGVVLYKFPNQCASETSLSSFQGTKTSLQLGSLHLGLGQFLTLSHDLPLLALLTHFPSNAIDCTKTNRKTYIESINWVSTEYGLQSNNVENSKRTKPTNTNGIDTVSVNWRSYNRWCHNYWRLNDSWSLDHSSSLNSGCRRRGWPAVRGRRGWLVGGGGSSGSHGRTASHSASRLGSDYLGTSCKVFIQSEGRSHRQDVGKKIGSGEY